MSDIKDINHKVLDMYRNGTELDYIIESLNITYKMAKNILINYKNSNRKGKTFTDEFKELISDRDMEGVTRKKISEEMEINSSTVKKACELFGKTKKSSHGDNSDKLYTPITPTKTSLDVKECYSCDGKKMKRVDKNAIYCMDCGDEFILIENRIHRVNWEYMD